MRRSIGITMSLLLLPLMAKGQDGWQPRSLGYVFFAPGTFSTPGEPAFTYRYKDREGTIREFTIPGRKGERQTTRHFGGGYERLVYRGLGVSTEIGVQKEGGASYGLFSANGSYHFTGLARIQKLVPFLTAGYSGAFNGGGGESWVNFGGGVDYWFRDRVGLRLEFRDNLDSHHREPIHFLGFRVGLAWR